MDIVYHGRCAGDGVFNRAIAFHKFYVFCNLFLSVICVDIVVSSDFRKTDFCIFVNAQEAIRIQYSFGFNAD